MRQFNYLLFILLLLLGAVVVSVQAGGRQSARFQGGETYKVVAEPGELDANAPGVTLLADYGSYQLFSVTKAQLRQLSNGEQRHSFVVDDMNVIEMNGHVLDTQNDAALMFAVESLPEPAGNALQLIQFVGPIKDEWLAAVRATDSIPIHYIANNAYLVWADGNGRSQLNAMRSQETVVQFSVPLQPYLKLSPALVERMEDGGETATSASSVQAVLAEPMQVVIPIAIQMIQHPDQAATEAIIEDLLLRQSSEWQPILKFQTIVGTVAAQDVETIAQLPDVYWIGIQQPRELMDEVQGQIVAGSIITTSAYSAVPTGPGYMAWLDSYGFSKNPADYPIVDITDDGIGNGNANDAAGDPTFREFGLPANNSRLAYIGNCTDASNGGGVGGHGHLNLSIAGGYDTRSGDPYRDSDGYQLGLGINPYGRFSGTRVFNFNGATYWDTSACGSGSDTDLIKQNQDSGAAISNNSWGDTLTSYGYPAQAYDVGVRDADLDEPGNQELIYIFSAGNQGRANSIGNPGTAKNVITVGSSENYRPYDIDGCNKGSNAADDVMDIAAFSSQGPAAGGRVKPELVAPGSHVQATASTNLLFNGNTVCGAENNNGVFPANDAFYPEGQSVFTWSSGTSHSAPAIAGIASLYYYWLENSYHLNAPSPALMKAYLIAHTLYLTGALANDTLPSNTQGYGLPDMSLGLDDTSRVLFDQKLLFGQSGEEWTKEIEVVDPTKPVRIVMAYTDAAGAVGSSPQVNDLNLRVDTAAKVYLGNHFQWQWSVPDDVPDTKNNYEAIFLPPGETDGLTIRVTAFNIAGDGVPNNGDVTDQDFALVCYNCAELLQVTPASQTVCTLSDNDVVYTVAAQGLGEEVTYSSENLPPSATAVFNPNPVTLPASSTLTISNLGASVAGEYLIDIQGVSSVLTRTTQVGLELVFQNPVTPGLTLPLDGANVEPDTVLLTWEEAAQGQTYSVEIATDSAFTNIVEFVTELAEFHYQTETLSPNTTYYWRVGGSNDCGDGSFSLPFSFSTLNIFYMPVIVKD
ncbi:MAG: S8 family serine peptidase [Aquificales bacterium]|nr:S8 family serine peptidase [Aquificales bacterium]